MSLSSKSMLSQCVQNIKDSYLEALANALDTKAAGEVVEVAQPGRVKVGDRVVVQPQNSCGTCPMCAIGEHIHCQSARNIREIIGTDPASATYAQYMHKMEDLLSPIPEGVSYTHAGMACCGLGPTFGAMEQMQVNSLDTVMVTGLGPVGLGGDYQCTVPRRACHRR